MSRRSAALVALALAAVLAPGCSRPTETPVLLVESRPFVASVTAEGVLEAKETTKISVPMALSRGVRVEWLAPEGSFVEEGDPVARLDGSEIELDFDNAVAMLLSGRQDTERTQAESDSQLGAQTRDYEIAELELDFARDFRLTDDFVFSRFEIIEDRIDEELAGVRRDHARDLHEIYEDLGQTQLDILDIERENWRARANDAEEGIESLEATAPHSGLVRHARNWRGEPVDIGDQLWPGRPIAELPSLDTLEAEVFVLESDAGGIVSGLPATVTIESRPGTVYPARVVRVDAAAKPRVTGSPVQYFGVTLEFESELPDDLKPGQRLVATLTVNEFTEAIVVPRQAIFRSGEEAWVYRQDGGGFERTAIRLGPGSAALTTVESGLEDGDKIALARPPTAGKGDAGSTEPDAAAPGGTSPHGDADDTAAGSGA